MKIASKECNDNLKISTLDGEKVSVEDAESIITGSVRVYKNLGLPFPDKTKGRGDLIVHFVVDETIDFPEEYLKASVSTDK